MDAPEAQILFGIILAITGTFLAIRHFIASAIKQQEKVSELHQQAATAEINALEKDRARIAVDLHDDLSPKLSAIKMKINSFDLDDQNDIEQLTSCNEIIDDFARKLRKISFDLMPGTLIRKGVFSAIEEFADHLNQAGTLKVRLHIPANEPSLPPEKLVHIYRILQEIVHNTVKHAGAHILKIEIRQEHRHLVLFTADDGVGFDHDKALKDKKGIGLSSLLNRIQILGGDIEVESKKGKGTIYMILIPV